MLTEDYKEITHETVFFKLPVTTKGWENTYLVVWTTTPWTIPANVAIAINTKVTYAIWQNEKTQEKIIFIAKDENGVVPTRLLKNKELPVNEYIFAHLDSEKGTYTKLKELSGKELLGLNYFGPFDDLPIVQNAKQNAPKTFHKVVDGSKIVMAGEGTGLLHIATGAGKEDFDLGKELHLPIISPIDDTATYVDTMGAFSGKNAKKHPELIIDYLKQLENGRFLLKTLHYTHRYPACWRCKTELVWKIAHEWYISMDKPEKGKLSSGKQGRKTLRQQMIETAKKIDWHPSFGLERELDWLTNMHDWLISKKNRYWGLALPIYECPHCSHFEVFGSKEELKEHAVSGWKEFEGQSPHKPYIDEVKIKCSQCGEIVSRLDDVGNVWLDAGIIPFSTLIDPKTQKLSYTGDKKYFHQWFPADFITESFPGQFKNWFYSLIAMATVLEKTNPFKTILGYASVLAEDGRPMHKSWGNSIEFNEGADKIGVDVMRWMYVTNDPEQNLLFGYKKADETRRRFHLMLWNIYNFFITYANIDHWEPDITKFATHTSENALDRWIISKLHGTINTVTQSLEKYDAQHASLTIESFVEDLSLWYVRRSRERVGPTAQDEKDKKAFYETMYAILLTLCKLLAPFTPFLSEEIYTNLTSEESVHLTNWPLAIDSLRDEKLEKAMEQGRKVASLVLMKRKVQSVKVRIPLKKVEYTGPDQLTDEVKKIVSEEVNVQELQCTGKAAEFEISSKDEEFTNPSNQDAILGEAREIVRMIQEERKKLGTKLDEKIDVSLPSWPVQHEEYIKRNALVNNLSCESSFKVKKRGQ
jgi:isoleucyl-tRNA synthetase